MSAGLLSFAQTLEYLGINKREIKELIKKKEIVPYKIGGTYVRFKKEDLDVLKSHLEKKIRKTHWLNQSVEKTIFSERLADFWYFNNFYIILSATILILLIIIFK